MNVLLEELNVVVNANALNAKIKRIVQKRNKMKLERKRDVIVKNPFVGKNIVSALIEVSHVLMNAIAWIARIGHKTKIKKIPIIHKEWKLNKTIYYKN